MQELWMPTHILIRYRLILVIAVHVALILLSNYLAFMLRFEGEIPGIYRRLMIQMFPLLLAVRGSIFVLHRLYKGLWRYTSIWDLWKIVTAVLLSSLLFFVFSEFISSTRQYPRSIYVIDSLLLVVFLGGVRLPWRIYRELSRGSRGKRVLIYGAGDAGEMIVRDMKQHPDYRYNPVGFVDDDKAKVGQSIHGVGVLGTGKDLPVILADNNVEEIILAIPGCAPSVKREVLSHLEPFKIPIKTTPNLRDILDGRVTVSQIRSLSVEDLLTRMPVDLDLSPIKRMFQGKRVLITGAGGSIGSEMCRQIANLGPGKLILFERYENSLYDIAIELNRNGYGALIHALVGDVTDRHRVKEVFEKFKPEVIFHAAAHKHVPMMEANAAEAVKNNITGTRVVAIAAAKNGAEKFVLVSTDKAVNPTSIMGATKRIAEMIVHAMSERFMTSFVAVRFGNVLGSNGSVVPLFQDQIRRGGPVTVTHPDMQRYFMLIPEAVQLVLFAAAMNGDAETYVLQMGEQINISEMARNLIRLSGFIPEVDIPIRYIGLRPGEKLSEELVGKDEVSEPSGINEILKIRQTSPVESNAFRNAVRKLEIAARSNEVESVLNRLAELVPTISRSAAVVP